MKNKFEDIDKLITKCAEEILYQDILGRVQKYGAEVEERHVEVRLLSTNWGRLVFAAIAIAAIIGVAVRIYHFEVSNRNLATSIQTISTETNVTENSVSQDLALSVQNRLLSHMKNRITDDKNQIRMCIIPIYSDCSFNNRYSIFVDNLSHWWIKNPTPIIGQFDSYNIDAIRLSGTDSRYVNNCDSKKVVFNKGEDLSTYEIGNVRKKNKYSTPHFTYTYSSEYSGINLSVEAMPKYPKREAFAEVIPLNSKSVWELPSKYVDLNSDIDFDILTKYDNSTSNGTTYSVLNNVILDSLRFPFLPDLEQSKIESISIYTSPYRSKSQDSNSFNNAVVCVLPKEELGDYNNSGCIVFQKDSAKNVSFRNVKVHLKKEDYIITEGIYYLEKFRLEKRMGQTTHGANFVYPYQISQKQELSYNVEVNKWPWRNSTNKRISLNKAAKGKRVYTANQSSDELHLNNTSSDLSIAILDSGLATHPLNFEGMMREKLEYFDKLQTSRIKLNWSLLISLFQLNNENESQYK